MRLSVKKIISQERKLCDYRLVITRRFHSSTFPLSLRRIVSCSCMCKSLMIPNKWANELTHSHYNLVLYTSFADLLTRTFLIMLRLNEFTAFCEDSSSRAVVSCLVTNVQTDSNEFDTLFRCATRNCVKLYESVIASVVQTSSWSVQCALQNTRRYSKLTFQAQNSPFPQIFPYIIVC